MGASLTTPRRPKNSDPAATLHNLCDQCWLTTAFVEQHDSTIKAARFIENACDGPDHENSYDEYNESDHGDWNDGYLDRFESEDMNNKRLDHHETREKLCESSSTGCHLCSLLYDLIRQDESLREALDEGRPYVLLCKIFKSVKKGFQGAENMIRSGLGSISIMEAAPIDLGEPVMCTLDLYHYSAPIEDNIWPSNFIGHLLFASHVLAEGVQEKPHQMQSGLRLIWKFSTHAIGGCWTSRRLKRTASL